MTWSDRNIWKKDSIFEMATSEYISEDPGARKNLVVVCSVNLNCILPK